MALMKPQFDNLEDLFWDQVKDIYDAEQRLTDALPKMADAANDPELERAFRTHLTETEQHVTRLETIFRRAGKEPDRETCEGIKGLLKEGEDMIGAKGDEATCDAGLIAAAQRVEHYEMAVYGVLRSYAESLGRNEFVQLLQQTLDEEGAADKKLTQIAETKVNRTAARH
jgi:ferritin-like metal-binding protein YciE